MSVSSYSQQNNWPAGATSLLASGRSTTGTYTYPTSLSAGVYAVQAYSLNKDTTGAYITATANAQTEPIINGETGYINLTTTESSFTLRPLGAAPTTFTSLYAQAAAVAVSGTYSIANGGGNYVLMGLNAAGNYALLTAIGSYNSSWTQTYDGITTLNGSSYVTYGGGKFVAMSVTGAVVSTDGLTWTNVPITGYNGTMQFIDYANNLWIASANNSSLYTSTDALTWTAIYGNFTLNVTVNQGVYANSKYTLVGASGIVASTTSNLRQWFSVDAQFASTAVNSIYFANSLYVIGGASGKLSTSTDAITWTTRTSGFGTSAINEVTYGNGVWIAAGAGGTLRSSTDAITWTARNSSFATSAINSVAYGAGVYVAVGAGGRMTNSTDGTTWNGVTTPGFGTSAINYITHTNGLFVAVGVGGRISSSTDGNTWTGVTAGTAILQAAIYFNGNYIVAGSTGNIWASTDLITWTQRTSNSTSHQFGLVSNGTNQVFAAGATGFINPSTDGVTWSGTTYGNPQQNPTYYNAAYGASKYLVSANVNNAFQTSTDGITWTTAATTPTSANTLTYGTAGFVFGDGTSFTCVSTDAITWTASAPLTWPTVQNKLTFANGNYIASTTSPSGSYYQYSTNGTTWTQSQVAGTSIIGRVIYDGSRYLTSDTAAGNAIRVASAISGTWTNYFPSNAATGIAVNGSTILAVASTIVIRSTNSGSTWTLMTPSTYVSGNYTSALYASGNYILSDSNNVHASTDLVNWYAQALGLGELAYGTTLTGNVYVGSLIAGSTAPIYYNDGTNFTSGWTAGSNVFAASSIVTGIGFIGTRLFVGASGKISSSYSITQSAWTEVAITNFTPYAFAGYERNYYAFGNSGLSYFSTDGNTWSRVSTAFGNANIISANYANGLFSISGNTSRMAFSTDGITWTVTSTGTPAFNAQTVNNNLFYYAGGSSTLSVYSGAGSYPMYYAIYGINPNTI